MSSVSSLHNRCARIRELPPGLSTRVVRVARAHGAGARHGMGLRLRQWPGEHRRSQSTSPRFTPPMSPPNRSRRRKPHPRVSYSVAPAERCALADASVDLVTVAQALHWFDVEAFYAEARRVARPGALLAVWNYPRPQFADAELDRRFLAFYEDVVGPYWPPERVTSSRTTARCHFRSKNSPPRNSDSSCSGSLEQVIGYVSSWSATARYRKALARDPVPLLRDSLAPVWLPGGIATVRMPIGLRAARLRRQKRIGIVRSARGHRRALHAVPCQWRPCAGARSRRSPGPARPCSRHWRR